MLEKLDAIDWSKLSHTYGAAEGTPALLRSLQSRDKGELEGAFYDLYGSLCHQGTVYSATAAAVPFLLELLGDPNLACREELSSYLVSLAFGYGEPEDVGGVRRALGTDAAALLRLLAAPEPSVRASAGWVLTRAEGAAPAEAMAARLREEPSAQVRVNLTLALGHLARPEELARLLPQAGSGERVEALARLLALARAAGPALTRAQAEALAQALGAGTAFADLGQAVSRFSDAMGSPARAVVGVAVAHPEPLLPVLGQLLEQTDDEDQGLSLANVVLDAALPDGARVSIDQASEVPLLTLDRLNPAQRAALGSLARADAAWGYGNIWLDLRRHGLPGEREELCALLGVKLSRKVLLVLPAQVPAAAQVATQLGRTDWLQAPFLFTDGETSALDAQVPEDPDDFPRPVMEAAGRVAAVLYRACVTPVWRKMSGFRFYPQLTAEALRALCQSNGWELLEPDLVQGASAQLEPGDLEGRKPETKADAAPIPMPVCLTWPQLDAAQQARAERFAARLSEAGWKEAEQSLGFAKQVGPSGMVVSPLCTARLFTEAADLELGFWVVGDDQPSPVAEFLRLAVVSKAGDEAMVFRLAPGAAFETVLQALITHQAGLRPDNLTGPFTEQVLAPCERAFAEMPEGLEDLTGG